MYIYVYIYMSLLLQLLQEPAPEKQPLLRRGDAEPRLDKGNYVGTTLELRWNYAGTTLELRWNYGGIHPGTTLELHWTYKTRTLM